MDNGELKIAVGEGFGGYGVIFDPIGVVDRKAGEAELKEKMGSGRGDRNLSVVCRRAGAIHEGRSQSALVHRFRKLARRFR